MVSVIVQLAVQQWRKRAVAIVLSVLGLATTLLVFVKDGAIPSPWTAFPVSAAVGGAVYALWIIMHWVPRIPKDKVGIVIALRSDDASEARRVQEDFVLKLRQVLGADAESTHFVAEALPSFAADEVADSIDARKKWMRKTRARLILWGSCKLRTIEGAEQHALSLSILVRHAPLPPEAQQELANEIGLAAPERLFIKQDGDLLGFEVSSGWYDIAARYVIGMAACVSGAWPYAERLFNNVKSRLDKQSGPPHLEAMSKKVDKWLLTLHRAWLNAAAKRYIRTRERAALDDQDRLAAEVLARDPAYYPALVAAAICAFVLRRDVASAEAHLRKCQNSNDATWRYSLAFLLAYKGDLDAAHHEYRRAFRGAVYPSNVPIQAEEFINSVFEAEPHRYEMFFCLGLINYNVKKDYAAAKWDFLSFLDRCPQGAHTAAVALARELAGRCDALQHDPVLAVLDAHEPIAQTLGGDRDDLAEDLLREVVSRRAHPPDRGLARHERRRERLHRRAPRLPEPDAARDDPTLRA